MKTPSPKKNDVQSPPRITCGLSLGLTLQPRAYESLRVDASFSIEGIAGQEAELWERVQKEVENQLKRQLENMLTGYAALKNNGNPSTVYLE